MSRIEEIENTLESLGKTIDKVDGWETISALELIRDVLYDLTEEIKELKEEK